MEKLNLNLCKNKKLEQYIINERKKIFGEKELENLFKQYEKTDFYKESNFQGSSLDPYYLLWLLSEELILFEAWCKRLIADKWCAINSNDCIKFIKKEKVNFEKFLDYKRFIEILHEVRQFRNELFHWAGNIDKVFQVKLKNKDYNEHQQIVYKGLSSIFIYKWIRTKI